MYRILVCDDERDIVSALRIYLTAEGYEVLEAYNGSEMLRLAATQEVHPLLLPDAMCRLHLRKSHLPKSSGTDR